VIALKHYAGSEFHETTAVLEGLTSPLELAPHDPAAHAHCAHRKPRFLSLVNFITRNTSSGE
jgi:hypothetical protein